jgi:hypothetical protein
MLKRCFGLASVAAALALVATTSALASGAGTVTKTVHGRNVVLFSNPATNPCSGAAGTLTATAATTVEHITRQADGTFWVTFTAQGTATFTPTNPSDASASGHFQQWFGESKNNQNVVRHSTGNFNLWGSDGSHIVVHMAVHVSTNASGVVTVKFRNFTAHCG